METNRLPYDNFQQWISTGVTLLDFNASWCQPCRQQERILKTLEPEFGEASRVKIVNVDRYQNLALHLGIQSIPTIIIYKNGREVNRFIGLQSKQVLMNALCNEIDQSEA